MMNVILTRDAVAKLRAVLDREDENACLRIRESRIGSCWNRNCRIVLRLGIDEREEDDAAITLHGLPFVIERDLLAQYGRRFSVTLDKQGLPVVAAD